MHNTCHFPIGLITLSWWNSHQSHECNHVHISNVYEMDFLKKKISKRSASVYINNLAEFLQRVKSNVFLVSGQTLNCECQLSSGGKRFQHALYMYLHIYWTTKNEYGNSIWQSIVFLSMVILYDSLLYSWCQWFAARSVYQTLIRQWRRFNNR